MSGLSKIEKEENVISLLRKILDLLGYYEVTLRRDLHNNVVGYSIRKI